MSLIWWLLFSSVCRRSFASQQPPRDHVNNLSVVSLRASLYLACSRSLIELRWTTSVSASSQKAKGALPATPTMTNRNRMTMTWGKERQAVEFPYVVGAIPLLRQLSEKSRDRGGCKQGHCAVGRNGPACQTRQIRAQHGDRLQTYRFDKIGCLSTLCRAQADL